ncbi:unnamed protein product [Cyprideis torosa]|uniref:Uncharacterized protein n=1 Tax=Cyprideis torosa TaxID=163714 RepID=A0A7R8WCX4_9CRUS|nr:unnamed protein product [Cyprideis torosa]CAG0892493.1 unnamed protein product [Cyprideis torosa]
MEDSEVTCDPNDFPGSTDAMPLQDVIPGSMYCNNQTCDVPYQINVREDDVRVKKGKNSAGQRQQKKLFICAGGRRRSQKRKEYSRLLPTEVKRFTCAVCGKSLSSKQKLQFHELSHTGEKPFACRICGKSFAQSSHLSTHKLTHTGEKPFAYRICGKGFRSRSGLRYHEKKHPEENKSVCALCGEPFLLVDELKKHLKWHIQASFMNSGKVLKDHPNLPTYVLVIRQAFLFWDSDFSSRLEDQDFSPSAYQQFVEAVG